MAQLMVREELNSLIGTLGQALGLTGLALDEMGLCGLLIDGKLQIKLEYVAGHQVLLLSAVVGECSEERELSILRTICDANFMMVGTAGGALGLTPDSRSICLTSAHPIAGMTDISLAELLEGFVSVALFWQARLEAPPTGLPEELNPSWTRV